MGKMTDALKRAEEERRRRLELAAQADSGPLPQVPAPGSPAQTPRREAPAEPVAQAPAQAAVAPPAPAATEPPPHHLPDGSPTRRGYEGEGAAAPPSARARLRAPARQPAPLSAPRNARRPDSRLITYRTPDDSVAEQFRTLRTNLLALGRSADGHPDRASRHVICVTSTGAGEGKTLVCANLAVALADYVGGPVLAVDGDLRKPTMHHLFGLSRAPGYSDVLTGQVPLTEAITDGVARNLKVLTAGRSVENPTELLGSAGARAVMAEWRRTFEFVLIDTPPVVALTDASILGAMSDGAMVVIRAGKTSRQAVQRCLDLLRSANVNVLGTVLNNVKHYIPGYIYKRV